MRPGPDLAKSIARDQFLEFAVEGVAVGKPLVDPGIAQDLAALGHAAVVALFLVHDVSSLFRHCEEPTGPRKARPDDKLRDEAIQTVSLEDFWIASRSLSSGRPKQ